MYYSIRETLEPVAEPVIGQDDAQYVALLSHSAWRAQKEQFDLGFDIEEPENAEIFTTHAQVNYDSLTGTFCIPNRKDFNALFPGKFFPFTRMDPSGESISLEFGSHFKILRLNYV